MRRAAKEVDAVENYNCEACGAKFKSKDELDGHVEREHAQQPSAKAPMGQEKKEQGS
jgi:hypothetical protein